MKLLVLGHTGMLGNAIIKFYRGEFCCDEHEVCTTDHRWPSEEFKDVIRNFDGDLVINCIGAIPQKTQDFTINYELPQFIVENIDKDIKYIHPDTDCIFDGKIEAGELYDKIQPSNATEEYGISKSSIMRFHDAPNLKAIRTSIIGIDEHNKSLLSWLLSQSENANGYINHYWNGITTLAWARISHIIFYDWNKADFITQIGTVPLSKYSLLCLIKDVFHKQIEIRGIEDKCAINRCLRTDMRVPSIKQQLEELKNIYGDNV